MSTSSTTAEAIPGSEPESLDSLDYDDWEGQFEFVGNGVNSNSTLKHNHSNGPDDDLNLSQNYVPNSKYPILVDEETFLSLQSNDDDGVIDTDSSNENSINCGNGSRNNPQPQSGYLISNALKQLNYDSELINQFDENDTVTNNNKKNNKFLTKKTNLNNLNINCDDIIRIKNKLNNFSDTDDNNNNNKMNDFSAELCENLTEQVRFYFLLLC